MIATTIMTTTMIIQVLTEVVASTWWYPRAVNDEVSLSASPMGLASKFHTLVGKADGLVLVVVVLMTGAATLLVVMNAYNVAVVMVAMIRMLSMVVVGINVVGVIRNSIVVVYDL